MVFHCVFLESGSAARYYRKTICNRRAGPVNSAGDGAVALAPFALVDLVEVGIDAGPGKAKQAATRLLALFFSQLFGDGLLEVGADVIGAAFDFFAYLIRTPKFSWCDSSAKAQASRSTRRFSSPDTKPRNVT
jgi:hypothetical protein